MLSRLITLSCLFFVLPAIAQETSPELKSFQGNWQVVELVEDGKVIPAKAIQNWLPSGGKVEIAENAIIFNSSSEKHKQVKVFSVDATKYPKEIEISTQDRKTGAGIYQFDNNKLVICLADPEKAEKPKQFAAAAGSQHILMVLQQVPSKTAQSNNSTTIKSKPETSTKPQQVQSPEPGRKILNDTEISKMLVGNWKLTDKAGALYITFKPNGTFSTVREYTEIRLFQKALVQTPFSTGTWSVSNGSLTAHITSSVRADRVNLVHHLAIRSITDKDLIFVGQLGRIDSAIRLP